MNASIRAFKRSLAKEADAISAFIEGLQAIRFPTAALAADNSCLPSVSAGAADEKALTLAADVCNLRAAAVEYRDHIAMAARGKSYPQIEPKWIVASPIEARAQHSANALRKVLGLPALPKSGWISHPYKEGHF